MILSIYRLGLKKLVLRLLFLGQIVFVFFNLIFGKSGLLYLHDFKNQNVIMQTQIESLKHEVESINKQLQDWQTDSFYIEKLARENLQMARNGDEIYFLNNNYSLIS